MNSAPAKMPWIGQSVTRLEDPPLVTGRGEFAGDINFPHQLHMRMVRSAHAHGRIVSLDLAPARALPGVFAVWSAVDIAEAERELAGAAPGDKAFRAAAEAATAAVDPLEDATTSAEFRRDLVLAVTRRALERAAA